MSPRPYTLGKRQADIDETRERILAAANRLLVGESPTVASFSIDAVAREAGVARMTVYYQFQSRAGLLEALFDHLSLSGGIARMPDVFHDPRSEQSLRRYIAILYEMFATHRHAFRRLRGFASIDPELRRAMDGRDERRRMGSRVVASHFPERPAPGLTLEERAGLIYTLSSFETFDTLAEPGSGAEPAATLIANTLLASFEAANPRPERE